LRACLTDAGKEIRANAFRILRHIVGTEGLASIKTCMELGIDLFIVRALTRDNRFDLEREQAIKLVRAFLDVDGGATVLSPAVVRILVSLAENPDDKQRVVALETICEIGILNTPLLANCTGIRVLFAALSDVFTKPGVTNVIVSTLVYLLDSETTRGYLRPDVELESIISGLTDPFSPPDRIKACTQILSLFLKTWTGVIYLCMNSKRSLKAVVDCLSLPNDVCRSSVLEMLFGVLGVKVGSGISATASNSKGGSLVHFQSVLLVVFMEVGLLEALSNVVQTENKEIATLATILASEIQQLSKTLPAQHATRIQSMAGLFQMASDFSNEVDRHCATAAFAHIDSFYETGRSIRFADVKEVVGGQIEDAQFKSIVAEAEKMFLRDSGKWGWDFIQAFLMVLLNNSRRADEVLRNTKILKRLLGFFKPIGSGFGSDMSEEDVEILRSTGCNLMRVLLSCNEGVRLLRESKFMIEIAEEFNKLDPINGPLPADALFVKSRMEHDASGIYFHFLSELGNSPSGMSILNSFKIFNMYYLITELQSREDLIKALVYSVDFTKDGHERVILSKLMTSSEKDVRLFATDFVGKLLFSNQDESTRAWCVEVLVVQMYDSAKDISEKAKLSLEAACDLPGVVEAILAQNPAYQMDSLTNPIYMRFLRTLAGFVYLDSYDYIRMEMANWIQFGIFNYVTRVELLLDEVYFKTAQNSSLAFPLHFYGELAKTVQGCDLLEETGHFRLFLNVILENKQDSLESVSCLKACLWAVGHIGASNHGINFLADSGVLSAVTGIASDSKVLSLRGTCVYILSLIGQSSKGVELLKELGWDVLPSPQQTPVALPVKPWKFQGSLVVNKSPLKSLEPLDIIEQDILKNIGMVSNHILAKAASRNLARIRYDHPSYFTKTSLYVSVMSLLSRMHYRLTGRRFIQELFDKLAFDEEVFERALSLEHCE
ncbi:Rapamycin-insensitive companion of mTOR, N-term-domain-containing protein, partial [Chytriomyces sp. MP71]